MTLVVIRALDALVCVEAPDPIAAIFEDLFTDLAAPDVVIDDDIPSIRWRAVDAESWQVSLGAGGSSITDVGDGLAESIVAINRIAAASVAFGQTVLHAGAFEVGGAAIAVTGASGAGKSTLVAAALKLGHGYLADEVCAIDPASCWVRPYHRPIGLRPEGAKGIGVAIPVHPLEPFGEVYPWVASRHGRLVETAPLRLLAFVERRPGPAVLTTMSPADALIDLTNLSLGTDGFERDMFCRLDHLVRNVTCVTVAYENSFDAVEALAEALG